MHAGYWPKFESGHGLGNPAPFGNARWFAMEDDGETAGVAIMTPPNPTSNAIYQRIGYRPVATAVEYRFR